MGCGASKAAQFQQPKVGPTAKVMRRMQEQQERQQTDSGGSERDDSIAAMIERVNTEELQQGGSTGLGSTAHNLRRRTQAYDEADADGREAYMVDGVDARGELRSICQSAESMAAWQNSLVDNAARPETTDGNDEPAGLRRQQVAQQKPRRRISAESSELIKRPPRAKSKVS